MKANYRRDNRYLKRERKIVSHSDVRGKIQSATSSNQIKYHVGIESHIRSKNKC
jgi:hypothetical protein